MATRAELIAEIEALELERNYQKTKADTLKIVCNGSFGKFGSKYSTLYAPDLLIQTTITGQLALLMLIERMELMGVRVVSANTDGIVLHYPRTLDSDVEALAFEWMLETFYELERTDYRLIASRDVNNYIAVKTNGACKGKGVFGEPSLSKNPETPIVFEAVRQFVANGTPIRQTIDQCTDASQFASVRAVQGGGQWQGQYLGKAVRFYYVSRNGAPITYRKNGNKVPKTDGVRPMMTLPDALPDDIEYQVYYGLAAQLLKDLGFNNA